LPAQALFLQRGYFEVNFRMAAQPLWGAPQSELTIRVREKPKFAKLGRLYFLCRFGQFERGLFHVTKV
jgi:hypothetical protein